MMIELTDMTLDALLDEIVETSNKIKSVQEKLGAYSVFKWLTELTEDYRGILADNYTRLEELRGEVHRRCGTVK